ncbi:MAG: LysR substrate-binding domain-containing protein, partial [Opitutales bacterium]|nr:LysR substrate-binding domain-containing protein [Opitutales bacterium]
DLIMMPCYKWDRAIVVPKGHALTQKSALTLEDIAAHPIVTYVFGFTGRSKLDEAFIEKGLAPKVVFTAADADVIKTYVRLGLGIGIVAKMAYNEELDGDLVALDASHLFESSITKIGFRRGTFLRGFMFEFIELFAPHLTKDIVEEAYQRHSKQELDELFEHIALPVY